VFTEEKEINYSALIMSLFAVVNALFYIRLQLLVSDISSYLCGKIKKSMILKTKLKVLVINH
jgi:hypothetical protein